MRADTLAKLKRHGMIDDVASAPKPSVLARVLSAVGLVLATAFLCAIGGVWLVATHWETLSG